MADNAAACAAEQGDDLARIVTELIALLPPKDTA
jgi:hypothetical protein